MQIQRRYGWLQAMRAVLPVISVTVAGSLAGLAVVRALVSFPQLSAAADAVGTYLQTLGTIYAVLMAFVVFVVWSQFNDARAQVEREANDLRDLHRTSRGLAADEHQALHQLVLEYVAHVARVEWPALASRDMAALDSGWRVLERMSDVVRACSGHTDVQLAHVGDLLARLDDLSDARSARITSSTLQVPLVLWLLLYGGAIMTVGSLYLFAVPSVPLHALLVATLAGAISHVLYLVRDLDNVFVGNFRVDPAPLQAVARLAAEGVTAAPAQP